MPEPTRLNDRAEKTRIRDMKAKGNDLNILEHTDISSTALKSWEQRVGFALRNLGDRSALNQNPLARISYIDRLARDQYKGHLMPRGLALRTTLLDCIDRISREVGAEPGLKGACSYLTLSARGYTCQGISEELGLSREHTSRLYRKKALQLLTEEFLSLTANSK